MTLPPVTPVAWMEAPGCEGRIGMMACPGGGFHAADGASLLSRDLRGLAEAGARALVTLLPDDELRMAGVTGLRGHAESHGLLWLHLPIGDMQPPGEAFEIRWQEAGPRLRGLLAQGDHVVVHCLAGLGRTGTVAARLVVDMGLAPEEAVRQVRAARPGAIQSHHQLRYVLALARR